jgi:hypothetical protein
MFKQNAPEQIDLTKTLAARNIREIQVTSVDRTRPSSPGPTEFLTKRTQFYGYHPANRGK